MARRPRVVLTGKHGVSGSRPCSVHTPVRLYHTKTLTPAGGHAVRMNVTAPQGPSAEPGQSEHRQDGS